MTQPKHRHPGGQPTGGRFAPRHLSEAGVALASAGPLTDPEIAYTDADLHAALKGSSLGGWAELTANGDVRWTPAPSTGAEDRHGFLIEAVDGGRYEVTDTRDGADRGATNPEDVPRTIQGMVARARAIDIAPFDPDRFTVADVGFWNEPAPDGRDQAHVSVDLSADGRQGTEFTDLHYYTGERRIELWQGGRCLQGAAAEETAARVCPVRGDDEPDGTAQDRLSRHLERLLRRTAARDDVPAWMEDYRVDGLTYEG